jgi:hypothetical protein
MSRWVLPLAAALALALLLLRPRVAELEPAPLRSPRTPAAAQPRLADRGERPVLRRNLFEFGEVSRATPAPVPAFTVPPVPSGPSPTPPPERLRTLGIVRQGGALRAAIVVDGEVAVLAVGEESDGVRVVSIDEDAGVRVREADGTETVLHVPEPRS